MKRWYDKNGKIGKLIEDLRKIPPEAKDSVIRDVMDLIRNSKPDILNNFDVPLDIESWHRRWYDNSPNLWLVFNTLRFADEKLLKKVIGYLEKEIASNL